MPSALFVDVGFFTAIAAADIVDVLNVHLYGSLLSPLRPLSMCSCVVDVLVILCVRVHMLCVCVCVNVGAYAYVRSRYEMTFEHCSHIYCTLKRIGSCAP